MPNTERIQNLSLVAACSTSLTNRHNSCSLYVRSRIHCTTWYSIRQSQHQSIAQYYGHTGTLYVLCASLMASCVGQQIRRLVKGVPVPVTRYRVYSNLGRKPDTCIVCRTALPAPCERLDRISYTPWRQTYNDSSHRKRTAAVLVHDTWCA